jgi:hypothetical protein
MWALKGHRGPRSAQRSEDRCVQWCDQRCGPRCDHRCRCQREHWSIRGSLVVEAVLTLWLFILILGCFIELARRGLYELQVHWSSFLLTRDAFILGPTRASAKAQQAIATSFGSVKMQKPSVRLLVYPGKLQTHVFVRFPSLYSFAFGAGTKRAFEMSRRCTLSFQ